MNTMILNPVRKVEQRFWRRLVLERLHRLFAIIIVLQLIQCFKGYWWGETYTIVYFTTGAVIVTELLLSRAFLTRIVLQVFTAAAATVMYAPVKWYGWPAHWRSAAEVKSFVTLHGSQFHPFFEIALAVIIAIHYMSSLGTNRTRAIVFILLSVLVMAGIDSFYPLELWSNIAWTVLAGLGWLVVLHLRQLRERHYDSWEALAERPFDLAVPAVLVIGLLMLAGILMPRAPVLLEDPYTIWLQYQNKDVPAFAGEGGYMSNNSTTEGGTAASSKSGYGRSDAKIGGGFQFDYSPVMEVTTNQKAYWRGESKAVYTGQGWTDRKDLETTPVAPGQALEIDPPVDKLFKTKKVTQTFTMLRKDRIPVIFAASAASQFVAAEGLSGTAKLTWNPEEAELKFQRSALVTSYTVDSEMPVLDISIMRQTPSRDAKAPIDLKPYVQLPDSVPERVRELAVHITDQATNDYDRAKYLENYLRLNYPYTNTPDLSLQKSKDIADAFLFEIKEGYCDYYSTAFVVLARSLGLPTRWVKGYTTGANPQDQEYARMGMGYTPDPNGAGTYTVRNADAHSWAEVYFEGAGWIPFEPTSGFSVPQPLQDNTASPVDLNVPSAEPDDSAAAVATGSGFPWQIMLWTVLGIVLGAAAWLVILIRRRGGTFSLWQRVRYRGTTPNQRIVREMERLLGFLHRKGLKRSGSDTLRETFALWGGRFNSLRPDFEGVLLQFENARYGGQSGQEADLQHFTALTDKIRKSL